MELSGEKYIRSSDRLDPKIDHTNEGIAELKSDVKLIAESMKRKFEAIENRLDDRNRQPEDVRRWVGDTNSGSDEKKQDALFHKRFRRGFTLMVIEFVALIVLMTVYKFII